MELRDYQIDISQKGCELLKKYGLLYLSMEVRTGKTLTALNAASLFGARSVLFITKLKAIDSITSDHKDFGYGFSLSVTNNESIHKIKGQYDLIVVDEAHRLGAYPKPSQTAKILKEKFSHLPIIYLSGTATPESYSQIYHQFWISDNSPFKEYKTFYKWAKDFVKVHQVNLGYGLINVYKNAYKDLIDKACSHLFISYTQKEAGFESSVKESILRCNLKNNTYKLCEKLIKSGVIQGKDEVILADTAVKLQNKLHQLYSGTIKFESGKSMIIDSSKADFIKEYFKGKKIGIFYKFKAEWDMLKSVFGDHITNDLNEFNCTGKNIALQIVSGREGISLKAADYLVYITVDFSAISYFQSRDRLTTIDRSSNEIFWIFSNGGIEDKIYDSVIKKKDYTLSRFKKDFLK